MALENRSVLYSWEQDFPQQSFENVLDNACGRLWEKHAEYSVRRIDEIDKELERLEKELDKIIES